MSDDMGSEQLLEQLRLRYLERRDAGEDCSPESVVAERDELDRSERASLVEQLKREIDRFRGVEKAVRALRQT